MTSNAQNGIGVSPRQIAGTTMKAVQMYSPYGYRGKIGLIVPSTNTVIEPEFNRMAPKGVSIHSGRIMLLGKASEESYVKMGEETGRAAAELSTAEVDVIAWGCTSGSCVVPREQLEGSIVENSNIPAVSTMTAVFEAIKAFGAKTISLGTPYVDFVNQTEIEVIEREGIKVAAYYGLELGETQEERRGIGRVPPESLFRLARHIDRPESDLIFLSCTNLATIEMLDQLEQDLGKPVISSNQATFWASLRRLGIRDRIEGYGSLLTR
jgi:arylmalonate decarboxylase